MSQWTMCQWDWCECKSECRLHNNGNLANRKDVIYEQQGT